MKPSIPRPPLSRTATRRLPRQDRARATFDAILEATAALLAERGYEGVNTNVVAERAGVKPPAVYRYFPNKFALYLALAEKLQGELDVILDAALVGADQRPLSELVDRLIEGAQRFWVERPAFGILWSGQWAMQGTPAPAVLFGERTVARFIAATARFRHLGPLRETITVAAAMQIGMALIHLGGAAPPGGRPLVIAEAKRALLAYLDAASQER